MSQLAPTETQNIIRDLGDGLILRRARADDAEQIITLNKEIFAQRAADYVGHFLRDDWHICRTKDFTVVEDTSTGVLISSLCLIAQTWSYDGIEFPVGQPEFVLTRPEYRRRGLIRAQIEAVHEWSEQRGDLVQVITGIPYYYRQFGYEMGLEFGGWRAGSKAYAPKLKEGETEPFLVRPATEDDLPFITATAAYGQRRYLVSNTYSVEDWRYILSGWSEDEPMRNLLSIITTPDGEPVGFLEHQSWLRNDHQVVVPAYELKEVVSWLAVTPSVIRYLCAVGEELAAKSGQEFATFNFWLGPAHPVYEVAPTLLSRRWDPYAFYVRVPDLPRFIRHIAPVLEQRLAESIAVGHTGELRLSFYRSGLRLAFEQGKLVTAESWMPQPRPGDRGMAGFPDLTFLQLLFGYRTIEEMRYFYADCWYDGDEVGVLLNILFPRRVSQGVTWASDD